MLTTQQILVEAYQRGHAWNPAFPSLQNLDLGRVTKMDGSERDAKDLIASRQASDVNMDTLVAAFHAGRQPLFDGDIGPATQALAALPRCAMPDFAPPAGASFHYDYPELQGAVESYQRWAEARDYQQVPQPAEYVGGSGSWPKGCDPERPNWHSVRVSMLTSGASTHQKGILAEVLKMVELTEAEVGQSVRHILDGDPSKAEHDVRFQGIAGSVIGFAYFPTPNSCNQTVTARIDNGFNARAPVLAELLTHEYKGHSDGLQHTRGGIMNPSIGSPTVRSTWLNDPHTSTKKRFFGGVAIPTTPGGPGPGPTPIGQKVFIRTQGGANEVVAMADFTAKKNDVLGRYIYVPAPEV